MSTSASRLFTLLGPSILRHRHRLTAANLLFSPPLTLRFHHRLFSSSAAVLDSNTTNNSIDTSNGNYHPWSEWVAFIDKLKTKGYLNNSAAKAEEEAENEGSDVIVYTDMNFLKDACLNFARDRFDIFKSMSRQEIQTVVDKGCPNLLRKAVNSAKRLRAYLRLDEGDVCSACNLRGSCDRAYVLLKGSEADARTVDIVRLLILYALDPLVTSGGVKTSEREVIEASAKKLLAEMIELSETPIDPALAAPAVKVSQKKKQSVDSLNLDNSQDVEMKRGDWICPGCNFMNFAKNRQCHRCEEQRPKSVEEDYSEMKKGDWLCSECNFMNFSKNVRCRRCGEDGPKSVGGDDREMKDGDWICSDCNFMNFARNVRCLKCKGEGPARIPRDSPVKKMGDWDCPQCNFMNFASKVKCLRCQTPSPQKRAGEWNCPSCNYLNFKGNVVCKRCNNEGPERLKTEYDEWKRI